MLNLSFKKNSDEEVKLINFNLTSYDKNIIKI